MSKRKRKYRPDHSWELIRMRYFREPFAVCQCGYSYKCSPSVNPLDPEVGKYYDIPMHFYPYCPQCGIKKTVHHSEIRQLTRNYKGHQTKFHLYDMSDYSLEEKEKQNNDKRTTGQNL